MKNAPIILLLFALVGLTACDTTTGGRKDPPSVGGVTNAVATIGHSVTAAQANAKDLQTLTKDAWQNGLPAKSPAAAVMQAKVAELDANLAAAKASEKSANDQARELQKQINDENREKLKAQERVQRLEAALMRRVGWLIGIIATAVVIYQGAAWGKNASPYTTFLPGPIAGALAVAVYIAVVVTILSIWTFGGNLFGSTSPPKPPIQCFGFSIDPDDIEDGGGGQRS